jgi:hypothetical protein
LSNPTPFDGGYRTDIASPDSMTLVNDVTYLYCLEPPRLTFRRIATTVHPHRGVEESKRDNSSDPKFVFQMWGE